MVTTAKTPRGILFNDTSASIEMLVEQHDIVEFLWAGIFDKSSTQLIRAYLDAFLQYTEHEGGAMKMLHDLTDLERYSRECLLEHAAFARAHPESIESIAVVSHRPIVLLGVATVAMWQARPIRWFGSRAAAYDWLQTPLKNGPRDRTRGNRRATAASYSPREYSPR